MEFVVNNSLPASPELPPASPSICGDATSTFGGSGLSSRNYDETVRDLTLANMAGYISRPSTSRIP